MRRPVLAALLLSSALIPAPVLADPVSITLAATAGAIAAGSSAAATAVVAGTAITFAAVAVPAAIGFVSSGLMAAGNQLMAKGQKPQGLPPRASVRQGTPILSDVYGRARVGGHYLLYHAAESGGNSRRDLNVVVVLAAHEIDAVEEIWDGDRLLWSEAGGLAVDPETISRNGDCFSIRLGAPDQTPPTWLLEEMATTFDGNGANFKAAGKPYVAIQFRHIAKNWGGTGPQSLWFVLRGKKVPDPRTGTSVWTDNWALCFADYLKTRGGLPDTALDEANLIEQANLADEDVTLSGGGTQKRYRWNGAIQTDVPARQMVPEWEMQGAGKLMWTGAKAIIRGGAYSAATYAFGPDDYVAPLQLSGETLVEDRWDGVSGTYADPDANYGQVGYDKILLDDYDPGSGVDARVLEIDLVREIDHERAQRLALLQLRQSRRYRRLSVSVPLTPANTAILPGARATFSLPAIGLSGTFEIVRRRSVYDPQRPRVELEAVEDAASFWSWGTDNATVAPVSLGTNLDNPRQIAAPTGLTVTPSVRIEADGATTRWLSVSWSPVIDMYLAGYEVRWTQGGESRSARTTSTLYEIFGLADASAASVSVVAVNTLGVESAEVAASATAAADVTPPGVPPSGSVFPRAAGYEALIGNPTDADFAALRLYESAALDTADPTPAFAATSAIMDVAATPGGSPTSIMRTGRTPGKDYAIYVTALDRSGNQSGAFGPLRVVIPTALTQAEIDAAISDAVDTANAAQTTASAAQTDATQAISDAAAASAEASTALGKAQDALTAAQFSVILDSASRGTAGADITSATTIAGELGQSGLVQVDTEPTVTLDPGGWTTGYRVEVPASQALRFGGRTVRVRVRARGAPADPVAQIRITYSTAELGNSGVQSFAVTTSWAWYSFTYAVPSPVAGGLDYVGIWGSESGLLDLAQLVVEDITEAEGVRAYFDRSVAALETDGVAWAEEVATAQATISTDNTRLDSLYQNSIETLATASVAFAGETRDIRVTADAAAAELSAIASRNVSGMVSAGYAWATEVATLRSDMDDAQGDLTALFTSTASTLAASGLAWASEITEQQATLRSVGRLVLKETFEPGDTLGPWIGSGAAVAAVSGGGYAERGVSAVLLQTDRSVIHDRIFGRLGGRTYRVTGSVFVSALSDYPCYITINTQDQSGVDTVPSPWNATPVLANPGQTVDFDHLVALPDDAAQARVILLSDGPPGVGSHQVRWMRVAVEDVTEGQRVEAYFKGDVNTLAADGMALAAEYKLLDAQVSDPVTGLIAKASISYVDTAISEEGIARASSEQTLRSQLGALGTVNKRSFLDDDLGQWVGNAGTLSVATLSPAVLGFDRALRLTGPYANEGPWRAGDIGGRTFRVDAVISASGGTQPVAVGLLFVDESGTQRISTVTLRNGGEGAAPVSGEFTVDPKYTTSQWQPTIRVIAGGTMFADVLEIKITDITPVKALADLTDDAIATVTDLANTKATATEAVAETLSEINAAVGGSFASVTDFSQAFVDLDGDVRAQRLIKVDASGNVATGFFGAGDTGSQIVFQADRIALSNGIGTGLPFELVGNTLYLRDVVARSAQIDDLAVTRLKIGNNAVDYGKIEPGAAATFLAEETSYGTTQSLADTYATYETITVPYAARVFLLELDINLVDFGDQDRLVWRVLLNGSELIRTDASPDNPFTQPIIARQGETAFPRFSAPFSFGAAAGSTLTLQMRKQSATSLGFDFLVFRAGMLWV